MVACAPVALVTFLAGLVGGMALAQNPEDQMFPTQDWCYARSYTAAHLASHPVQQVTNIGLRVDRTLMDDPRLRLVLTLQRRGSRERFEAVGYCDVGGPDTVVCGLEGDAGAFSVTPAKAGAVLVSVGRDGIFIEGAVGGLELSADGGDDRTFLLQRAATCQ